MGVVQSIGALLGGGLRELKRQEVQKTELRDLPRAGHPATANTPDMLNRADAIIRGDRRFTKWQLALQFSITTGSVCFRRVRPGKNPVEMLLLNDNVRPH
jgi:hypothetical protein